MNIKNLKVQKKKLFQKIYELRDKYAKELNYPPNVVIPKEYMFKLASGKMEIPNVVFDKKVSEKYRKDILNSLGKIL